MQRILTVCLLLASMLYGVFSATGQPTNQWRVSTKVRTVGSQKYLFEYTYSNDGRIQTVKQYSATGALIITISDFKFDKNGKPSYYLVDWNREGLSAKIYLEYDDNRRLINLQKVLDGNKEKTVFNYRYTGNTVTVFEQNPPSQKANNSSITYYTDNGDYTITTGDEASNTVKSVITLKKNPVPSPENEPDKFFGGYEAPGFLGIKAHASEPEITIRKNEKGLIVSRFITTTNSVEYTYTKINSSAPESENAVTTILTNINCEEGKRIIERLLKSQDGVKSAAVDIKTGKLKLDYNSDGTPYKQIISLINDAGFDADRVKSTNAENNPCAAKPSGNNITTIQTNINCEEGKRIIERILKSQDGVKSAIVDIKTGKLKLDYSSDGTPLTQIIFLINDAGFDADRVKSKNVVNNPCKTSLPKDVNSLSKDVYVAGFESNGAKNVAKVWKNGVATSLTNGTYDAAAHSVYVSGTDVYVSGNESNGTKEVAKVWKNGVATSLTNGTNDANASSVYVSGTDVYVAGYESNGTKFVAKVWKNGVATSLTNGANDASANSVYVSGTDIYVAGDESDGTTYVAKLWKNGVATSLTDGTNSAHPDGVYVSGTDVYVVGNERFEQLTGVAKVWKNGVATSLTNGSNHAFAKSVYVSGTDVYVAGMELKGANLVAKVWKNGVATTLTNGSSNGFTYSVYVSGKDVYVAGAESNGTKDVVKVWKNGVATSLTNGSNDGRAYSIFVTGSEKAITNPPTSKITTVQTNINCEEGKRAIEKLLKSQDGVKSASVDIKTGKLKLDYSSDGTPLTQIISLINEAGFDADRVKSTNAQNNPCIKKQNADKVDGTGKVPVIITPPPTLLKPVIFTTNINCAEGEEKVLPLIKKLTGVLDASVNTKTGWLGVTYNQNNKTLYDAIINVINDAGFDADNKKTIYPDKNPCIRIITHKDNKKPIEVGDNPYVVTPPKEIPKEVSQSKISTIKGKLFYRYKKEGEQPVSNALNLPGGSSSDKISYPDFVAAQRFPKTTDKGTQPLKNAKVSLVYTTLSPKQMNPSRYEDFPIPGFKPWPNDPLYKNYLRATNDPVIATGETDNKGNFSFTFYNTLALGYLGSFGGSEITNDPDKINKIGLTGTFHMYGALRLVINEVDYYSPDVLLFPTPGKTITIPDELGLVRSFDLTVTVKSNRLVLDQAVGTGVPISSYPINVGRLQSKISGDVPTNPFEARELEIGARTDKTLNGDTYKVFDQGITNGNGQIIFKNLSDLNDHFIQAIENIQAIDNKYDGSFVYKKQDQHLLINPPIFGAGDFNSASVTGKNTAEMFLTPKLPELYVTTQALVNGKTIELEGVDVTMYNYQKGIFGKKEKYVSQNFKTLAGGHLQVKDLPVEFSTEINDKGKTVERVSGPERALMFNKSGYNTKMIPNAVNGTKLQLGQKWPNIIVYMTGSAKLTGRVENESGESVAAEIKVADGPSVKTTRVFNHDGYFFLDNAATGNKITVQITPVVDQYFSETLTIDIPPGKTTDLGKIKLKEKLHRVIFKIIDENKKPVYDAWVSMNNSTTKYSTGKDGTTSNIEIASPANQFKVKVNADGFVSYNDYVIVPIVEVPKPITLTLIKGKVVSGYVKDTETKQPINKARVYTISGYNDDGAIEVETFTDEKGFYELRGISTPGKFLNPGGFKISNGTVTVYAVKSGEPAYIQQIQTAKGDNVTNINFELQRISCNSEIWGIPVEITSAERKGSRFLISGAFVKLPPNTTFKTWGNEKLPFKNVIVNIKETGKELGGSKKGLSAAKCTIEPVENSITTEVSELKIIAFDKFNCEVRGAVQGRGFENLVISKSKDGNCGILSGLVETSLESFTFSYKYTGGFILQPFIEKPAKKGLAAIADTKAFLKDPEMIEVFGANNCFAEKNKYRLAPNKDETFYVHNFMATFSGANSYVVKDTFSLGTSVMLNIPLVKDKSLNAGTIKVLENKIIWKEYKGDVNVAIETWNIKGTGLSYDINQGGFKVIDALLQTNLPELPLKSLIITPTNLDPGKDNIDPSKDVTLAGVASLTLNNAVPTLVLEQSAPHDQKQHWRLNLYNTTNAPVAYLQNIPGIAANDKIAINLFSNYSDGKKTLSINGEAHTFFKVMQQKIENIEIGKDYFTLIGNTDLQIPGSNGNITGRFKYMKENGQITCTPEKLNTDVELAGNVSFTGGQSLKDYELRDGYFSAIGSAQIYEKSKSDGFALTSKIIKDASGTRLELIPGQNLPVAGSSSQKMKINYGKAVVNNTNTSWENLKFNTTLQGYQVVKKGEDQLDFEVKGAIALDPNGKKLQLDNIETPLGGLELSFDFAKKSFYGQLRLDVPIIIPPGLFTIYKGIAEVQLDGNGFIFTGSFSEAKFNPLDFLEEFQLGLAVGYYSSGIPEKMANNLKMITQQKQIPASLSQGLKGVYVSVSKGFSKGVDIPIIDMNIGISAGLDIRVIVNFNNTSKPDVYVDLFGKAEGHAYVGDEYRTGGEVNYVISAIVGFKNGKFQLLFEPGVAVKAVLLGKTIKDIEGHIIIGIDGSSFTFKPSF